jgi:deoxyribonuclease-1
MRDQIYVGTEYQRTFYCHAPFNRKKQVTVPGGVSITKYRNRANRWEAEHIVPAENFGRTFKEWREGDIRCVNKKGQHFKGRNCASKVNSEYRKMQSDLYNLVPAIGSVNASRLNYNFSLLPASSSDFGQCDMRINNRKVQPPEYTRGQIARTYLYFELTYSRFHMSNAQRQLMLAWDRQYPVTRKECEIGRRIKAIQGNVNPVLENYCD